MLFGVLYLVFTKIFRFGGDVPHYPVMLLLGIVLGASSRTPPASSLPSLVQRESLLRKVAFPRAAIPVAVSRPRPQTSSSGLVVVLLFAFVDGVEVTSARGCC